MSESNIRLHGNGFIQIDVRQHVRMHVWTPWTLVNAQKVHTPIHNHTFSFRSQIVKGTLRNQPYRVRFCERYQSTHDVYLAVSRSGQDTRLALSSEWHVQARESDAVLDWSAGETYAFDAGEFHQSIPLTPVVITLMMKTSRDAAFGPFVLAPHDVEPDNDFNRYQHSEETLHREVMAALLA